jgi:replication factor A1
MIEKSDSNRMGDRPIVQAINVKSMNNNSRYRVILSDGNVYCQGMLATQLNSLANGSGSGGIPLETGCIIRVDEYMCNVVSGKRIIILLQMEVIGPPLDRIGHPTEYVEGSSSGGTGAAAPVGSGGPNSAAPMYNRTNTAGQPPVAAATGGSNPYSSGSPSGGQNPYSPAKRNSGPIVHNTGPAGMGGSSPGDGGPRITPISQLNMYQNRFTIKARVTSKSDIKTWSNAKGEGSLFSIELLDASGMDIRATMFKEAVDKFYNYFEVGKVYTITGARLKVANMAYNTCKSSLEMTIDHNSTEVHLVDDVGDIQAQSFDLTKIGALEQVPEKSNVDILAIVQEVGEVQSLTSKKTGNELLKCDLTLIDDTGVQVKLTLWGKTAQEAPQKFGAGSGGDKPIVAFRRARVSDYGGKSLSGGDVHVEPNIPETESLREWWTSQGSRASPSKSLSSSGGAGGRVDSFTERKCIRDIKQQNLGYNDTVKGDYLSFRAYFSFLKKDKEGGAWYPACPNKEEPCRNRCKVSQTTDGNWQCDRCHGTYPTCTYKWIFSGTVSDDTSTTWVSVFDEQAQQLFGGITADQAQKEFDNQDAYDGHFAMATNTEWIMKCRVKQEEVNGETRLKTQVVRMDPVNYVSECREMIAALEKM